MAYGNCGPNFFGYEFKDDQAVLDAAFYIVVGLGLKTMLQPLIHFGTDPNRPIKAVYNFPIIEAASRGLHDIVHELIQMGADVTVMNERGYTALHLSVSEKKLGMA